MHVEALQSRRVSGCRTHLKLHVGLSLSLHIKINNKNARVREEKRQILF